MNIQLEKLTESHCDSVLNIFNYYVENTNYAFRSDKLNKVDFRKYLDEDKYIISYAILHRGEIVGYCHAKPYAEIETFSSTVEIGYFISKNHLGQGIGRHVLNQIEDELAKINKKNILAKISGDNQRSIQFHLRHGFSECGRFSGIGNKFGKDFDIVYMQKKIGVN